MEEPVTFKNILEACIENLEELLLEPESMSPFLQFYARAQLHYMRGDVSGLAQDLDSLPVAIAPEEQKFLEIVIPLRYRICSHSTELSSLQEITRSPFLNEVEMEKRGEIYFVIAVAYEELEEHAKMKKYYLLANQIFEGCGIHKKAIKARLNFVAAESRIYPEKKLIDEYYLIYKKARKLKAYSTAAVAMTNISREYQLLGAYVIALKCINLAIKQFDVGGETGSRAFFLALVHRCHLFLQLRRLDEARVDYDLAAASGFREIRASLKLLSGFCVESADFDKVHPLTPTWAERREVHGARVPDPPAFSPLEEKLISLLSQRASTKYEMIEHLWGGRLNLVSGENRLGNLLYRIKRKRPHLVTLVDGYYRLMDELLVSKTKAGSRKAGFG